jgi:hypothetical protein
VHINIVLGGEINVAFLCGDYCEAFFGLFLGFSAGLGVYICIQVGFWVLGKVLKGCGFVCGREFWVL